MQKENETKIKIFAKEFVLPLIRDAVILGSNTAIGPVAMEKSLEYLHSYKFTRIDTSDDIVSTLFIRENILLKISKEKIVEFFMKKVKPLMSSREIVQIEIEVETIIEESL